MFLKILRQEGFTLVEILVALTVLSIIIIFFSSLFINSSKAVISAGNKTRVLYTLQEAMENTIAGLDYVNEHVTVTDQTVTDFSISFSGIDVILEGTVYEVHSNSSGQSITLKTFVPER